MKFNLITRQLFTEDGTLLKKLHCPYGIAWKSMMAADSVDSRLCCICDKKIYDTAILDDASALRLVQQSHDTCLKIDLNQSNLNIVTPYGGRYE